jgi:hypothetical protein
LNVVAGGLAALTKAAPMPPLGALVPVVRCGAVLSLVDVLPLGGEDSPTLLRLLAVSYQLAQLAALWLLMCHLAARALAAEDDAGRRAWDRLATFVAAATDAGRGARPSRGEGRRVGLVRRRRRRGEARP